QQTHVCTKERDLQSAGSHLSISPKSCDDVKKVFTVLSADNSDDHLLVLPRTDGDGKIGNFARLVKE
uniref:Uncharacterized protein n=1 Tax=Seriola dumerili TaxID=41447 RepID=A0A3B4V3Q5_SERDU